MKTSRTALLRGPGHRRGSALIIVLLVVLVLTIVGIGVAFFSSTEDRTSGNAKMSRVGFYAAEAGLRLGESVVTGFAQGNNGSVGMLLNGTPANTYLPPGGGRPAYILVLNGVTYKDVVLTQTLGDANQRPMYSLYVRNNQEDVAGGDNGDTDFKINLIAVGQMVLVDSGGNPVRDANGQPTVGITKVLEEQLDANPSGSAAATQKGANAGGTGGGAK